MGILFLYVLFDLKKLISFDNDNLKRYCVNLEFLFYFIFKYDNFLDLDASDLLSKLKVYKDSTKRKKEKR